MRHSVVVALLLCIAGAGDAAGQSIGQLAQQEAERRRAIAAPARVIMTADLTAAARLSVMGLAVEPPVAGEQAVARRVAVAPAVFQGGAMPQIPVQAVSGGEVLLEASVDREGRVTSVTVLRHTPPFTQEVIAATAGWRFQPAQDADAPAPGEPIDLTTRRAIDSKVLVIGLFRPPALFPTTLGQPPATLALPSEAVPAPMVFPAMPSYPPQGLFDGVVLAELRVGANGAISNARVVGSAGGLDAAALDVLRGLTFRPAHVHGVAVPAMVYAVAAFRQPVITSPLSSSSLVR